MAFGLTRRRLHRDFEAGEYLDLFLVSAVTSVLAIRFYLHLTNYPTVGGDALHVAHVLWGGLLMLVAIVLLLSYVGRPGRRLATVLGGVGFGAFIDEVGKFVTHDNDYFYEPAVAIMYGVFVLMYIAGRSIHREQVATPSEYLVNAVKELDEVIADDLNADERTRAVEYIERAGRDDALSRVLIDLFQQASITDSRPPDVITRVRRGMLAAYERFVNLPGFSGLLIAFFVFRVVVSVGYMGVLFATGQTRGVPLSTVLTLPDGAGRALGFIDAAHVGAEVIVSTFVVLGIIHVLRRRRLAALRMFQRSVLAEIFLAQVLVFYREEWAALIGLAFNLLIFWALRFGIERERVAAARHA